MLSMNCFCRSVGSEEDPEMQYWSVEYSNFFRSGCESSFAYSVGTPQNTVMWYLLIDLRTCFGLNVGNSTTIAPTCRGAFSPVVIP